MDFSVLTSDFKKQLQQQRSRLLKERDGIVKAAVAQASQTVDENISHINALLGEAAATPTKKAYTRPSKVDTIALFPKAPKGKAMSSKSTATKAATKTKLSGAKLKSAKSKNAAASPKLESAFSDLTPAQAIVQVLQGASGCIFNVDEVIAGIYGVVNADVMPKTRQKIGVTLGHCARRGEFTKVQSMPAQYRWDG